ncbi:MAG: hypothetical protein J0G28_07345 [Afipia sp.]|nr:hypothetical protein [Afipia sp.]OJW63111.1 MAG: hypothetical protein BGO65_06715 [Afipia sp. 64-13]
MNYATTGLPQPNLSEIHPLLRTSRDTRRMIFVRLLAYVSGLAVLAALLADLFGGTPAAAVVPAPVPQQPDWIAASRPQPAFAVTHLDSGGIPDSYQILRSAEGGRKDVLRWAVPPGPDANVEIELYRPGEEAMPSPSAAAADLAERIGLPPATRSEAAGIIASKLGPVDLIRFSGSEQAASCLGFVTGFDDPALHLSGWSCQKLPIPQQRAFVACALDRLMLLSAGSDPRLAALFARAELRRSGCGTQALAGDWITQMQEPALRGRL